MFPTDQRLRHNYRKYYFFLLLILKIKATCNEMISAVERPDKWCKTSALSECFHCPQPPHQSQTERGPLPNA